MKMYKNRGKISAAIGATILIALATPSHGETWDLARDWNQQKNPSGVWSYEAPGAARGEGEVTVVATQSGEVRIESSWGHGAVDSRPLHHATDDWTDPGNRIEFPRGTQPVWQLGRDVSVPMLFLSAGTCAHDVPQGRVGGHSPLVVRWTAPRDTTIDIAGGAWFPRELKRRIEITLGKTTSDGSIAELFFYDIPLAGRNSSFDSSRPLSFAHAAKFRTEARLHDTLQGVKVNKGDSIWLLLSSKGTHDDFVGIDFSIKKSSPEPPKPDVTPFEGERLFTTARPSSEWVEMMARGYRGPVTGVIYRRSTPAVNGVALGGIDTGCLDVETSGLWGYCTIFNTHVPRRGPMNLPFLGLNVGGQTWVMCDPQQTKPGLGNFQPPFLNTHPNHVEYL